MKLIRPWFNTEICGRTVTSGIYKFVSGLRLVYIFLSSY